MNHPAKLVSLYRAFYKASKAKTSLRISSRKSVQPVFDSFEIIVKCDSETRCSETLKVLISGHLMKLMDRIRNSPSDTLGRWMLPQAEEAKAIGDFAEYIVDEVFYKSFGGDVGRIAGRQRGYIEDACEFLYRLEDDKESKANA